MLNKVKSPDTGNNHLLFDFTVDKATKTIFMITEFDAAFRWCGLLLPTQKFLTNGWHLNPGYRKQNI